MDLLSNIFPSRNSTEHLIDMQLSYENLLAPSEQLYQKELVFNKFLPYAEKINNEADHLLEAIKSNLGKCVMQRNIYPACLYWTKMLNKYLMLYSLRFTKSEHITFIKLMYELITVSNLDASLVKSFAKLLIYLLKKKELISPDELELPWKPLYEICNKFLVENFKQYSYFYRYPEKYGEILKNLVFVTRTYFPVSATSEIVSELKPKICPFDKKSMNIVMKLFSWFLPVELPAKYHTVSHLMWLTDFLQIWESCNNSPEWESDLMSLLSHLAANNIGTIQWESQIPLMFTRLVRAFDIPAFYKSTSSCKSKHKLDMTDAARWTASVIGNHHKESTVHLAALLKLINPYLFPTLTGEWTIEIKKFIFFTIHFFVLRLRKERYAVVSWQEESAEEFKLTDANVDEFVEIMLAPVLSSLKSSQSFVQSQMSLKYLALLRPNVVIPKVLEIFYPNVGEAIEKYKLFMGTCSLESVSRPLVMGSRHFCPEYGFANGQRVVIPLLFSTLEAIDLNEGLSCWSAVSMLRHLVSMITLVDCSRGTLPVGELERQVCQDTARLEEFVLAFLDKMFALIEASSVEPTRLDYQSHSSPKSSHESMMEESLFNVTSALLRQCSRAIFGSALNKFSSYVVQNSLQSRLAANLLAIVCRVFAQTDGQLVLSKLLPELLQKLAESLVDGQDEELTDEVAYTLLLLQAALATQGNHLLPYLPDITQLLDRLVRLDSADGQRLANQLLANVLASFSSVQCIKLETSLDEPEHPYWSHWAESVDLTSARIRWYLPGRSEQQAARLIFTRYMEPPIRFIQACLTSRQLLSRDELRRCFRIILKLLEGCDSVLPMWRDESTTKLCMSEFVTEFYFEPTLGNEYEISMPNGQNVRLFMVKILSALQQLILDLGEDDTISLELLQEIWRLLVKDKSADESELHLMVSLYDRMKITTENPMVGDKGYLPEVLLERMTILQTLRKMYSTYPFTKTTNEIMANLFKLATNKYLKIRLLAQETLENLLDEYPSANRALLPQILQILAKDVPDCALKGTLYVIHLSKERSMLRRCQDDWLMLSSLLPALVQSKPSENLTIIRQLERIVEYCQKFVVPSNLYLEVSDTCVAAASQLWINGLKPLRRAATEKEISKGIDDVRRVGANNKELLNSALDKLIDAAQCNHSHWRHRRIAVRFILALLHPQTDLSFKMTDYFLRGLISDSIEERKSAITMMMHLFKLIKKRPLKQLESITTRGLGWQSGINPANESSLYARDSNGLPRDENRWENTRFLDNPCVSYCIWPEKYAFYAPPSQQPLGDRKKWPLTEQERVIEGFFNDNVNLKKLLRFLSLEEKGNDQFSLERAYMFKGLFRKFGNIQLSAFLECLNGLVQKKEESKQRCAAEIVCGLVCGSKHWPFSAIQAMWLGLHTILKKILENVTEETIANWRLCVKEIFRKLDPRRLHELLEFLADESFSSESRSSFHDSARLLLLASATDTGHRWRLANLFDRLMPKIESRLLNEPFDNVRSCLVSLLIIVFDSEIKYGDSPSINDVCAQDRKIDAFVENTVPQLQQLQQQSILNPQRRQALSALCQWTLAYESSMHCGLVSSMYKLYPMLSHMEHSEANPELADECRRAVAALARMFLLPRHVPAALDAFEEAANSTSSPRRASAAQFFLIFLSRNMSLLIASNNWTDKFRDITLLLIKDPRQEVREVASRLLNMMLLCGILRDATNYLEEFRQLARTKLHEAGNRLKNVHRADALRLRHAGVLGLSAFVQAHPHDIPKFIPPIFEIFAVHLDDPHPIPVTIRNTLSEFRRTHCDAWTGLQGIAKHFTEEQFSILQNLIVPLTHYA